MPRRQSFLLGWLALAFLQSGCLLPGGNGPMAQKHRDTAPLPPAESATLCLAVADQLAARGHYPEAIHQLMHVRHLDPKMDLSPRLARLHAKVGNETQALEEYEKAIRAHPKDAHLLNDLGYFQYERGNWLEAERALRKALEIEPEHNRAWMNLGLTLGQQGKYAEALVAFEQAGKPAEARCNLAFIYGTQGKVQEAQQLYQEALELDPGLKLARVALGKLDPNKTSERSQPAPQRQPVTPKAAPVTQTSLAPAKTPSRVVVPPPPARMPASISGSTVSTPSASPLPKPSGQPILGSSFHYQEP